jgi:3-oxoacyl-[acyl-carrier-protein] synthase-3
MRFDNVSILSVAQLEAPHRISSDTIEARLEPTMSRLGVHPDLLRALSGIEARRFWDEGVEPSDVATRAAELAIERAGIDRSKLGILINTSVCRDYIEPSTACIVHGNLKLGQHCMNFDLANACLGFLNGMDMIANMIDRGQVDYGIVVDGEGSRFVTEKTIERLLDPSCDDEMFRTNFATLTLGSGAAAMVLCRSDLAPDGHRFLGGVNLAATQHCRLCHGQPDHMETDTKSLLIAGLELAGKTWAAARAELGWQEADLDHFVMHQVSKVHTEKVAGLLGLNPAKIYKIYPEYGNIGPASIPIVLAKLAEENQLARGQRIALLGIGSGLNCTMAEAVW